MKNALRLERAGWPDAMSMTPGQILFRSRFGVDEARDEFRRDATAARAAQADTKGWKALFKDDRT